MFAFILAPFVIILECFIIQRIISYLKEIKHITDKSVIPYVLLVILFGGSLFPLVGFFIPNGEPLKRLFTRIGFYWYGFFLYFLVGIGIALLIRLIVYIFKKKNYNRLIAKNITAIGVLAFTIIFGLYGVLNAHNLQIENYELDVDKKSDISELNIALIADLHIGYNIGIKEVSDMVEKVNNLNPDIVIVAGDIFDNEYEAIENPEVISSLLASIQSKYGTYGVYGNHDIQEKILMGFTFFDDHQEQVQIDERMEKFLEDSDIHMLYDDSICLEDSVVIYGRPDNFKINFGNTSRLTAEEITADMDLEQAIIVVDHEPSELHELAAAGVDVDLCGHTHDGQVWPLKYINYFIWENPYRYLNVEGMHNIVTSGVGLFGVNMRTFTQAEICNIKLNFVG